MSTAHDERGPVELLADEFLARCKRGEKPTIKEYCDRHPALAEEIRDVFEAVLMVEDLKPAADDVSGSFGESVRVDGQRLKQVGDYRILCEIGRGGMGAVYEAEQQALGRRVALKILPKTIAGNGSAQVRFQREAKAAARMHHTNIVPVFDVGQDGDHLYYAMQLIHGQGLDLVIDDLKRLRAQSTAVPATNRVAGDRSIAASLVTGQFEKENLAVAGPDDTGATAAFEGSAPSSAMLPGQSDISTATSNRGAYFRSVAQIGVQTASALSYAHSRGIIHRDIKPGNLILDTTGNVWVTDFGLAKTGDSAMTHTGDILGTIRYMSPERFRGQCDVRADVYALGMTLYEMLTLKPAFVSGDRLKLIELIRQTEAPSPRSIDSRIPRDLETIVMKAIDKDPKRRYQSADEMGEDLQRFVNDEPIKARRVGPVERFSRWCRRKPALAASFAATMLILVVGLSLVTWKWNAERKARADANTAREEVEKKAAELTANIERMNTANRLLESGHDYARVGIGGGNFRAYDFYSRATEVRPEHSATWTARAQLCINLGLWDLAAEDLAEAARLKALGADPNGFCRAALCLRFGDQAGFVRMRDAMLESADRNYFMNLVWVLRTSVLSPDAPEAVSKALADWQYIWDRLPWEPRSQPWNLYVKGIAHYRLGQYNEALEELNRALEIGNWQALDIVYPIIAMTQFRLGRFDEANKALERARQAADQWDGRIFVNEQVFVPVSSPWDWLEFLWYFDEASKLVNGSAPPESPRRLAVHARALALIRKVDLAAKEFRHVAELAPTDPQIRFACFKFQVQRKRLDPAAPADAAAVELAAVTKVQPNDPQVHLKAFRVYADSGFWNEAKAQHQRAIELAPADRKIALEHYRYHADRGEWPQTDAAYAEQLARAPDEFLLRVECGFLHVEAGRWERVFAEYAKIVSMRPDDVWSAWLPYAVVCLKTGRTEEYRKTCVELFKRFEKTSDRNVVGPVSMVCSLAPNPLLDSARLVEFSRDSPGRVGVAGHCLYRNGQFAEAIDLLTKRIRDAATDAAPTDKYFLAMAYQRLGKYSQADGWLREATQAVDGQKTALWHLQGNWPFRLDLEMLREEAEQLIYGKGRHRPAIDNLLAKSNWQAALDRLDTLAKDDEWNGKDWTSRGRCFKGLNHLDKALAAMDKALTLGADDYNVWFIKGVAHSRRGEWEKALAAFEHAEQALPRSSGVFHERAVAYIGLRQFDKALAAADRAAELGDNSAWIHFHRGEALLGLERFDDAIREFSVFHKAYPTSSQVLELRGECYARTKQWPEAIADFSEAIKIEANMSWHWYLLACAQLAAGHLDDYRSTCAKMLVRFRDTKSPGVAAAVADVSVTRDDAVADKKELVRLAKLGGDHEPDGQHILASALYRAGDYPGAIEQYDVAAKHRPHRAWDWLFLAMAHHRHGQTDQARACLAKAVKWIEEADANKTHADSKADWMNWMERVQVQHLRAEAESSLSVK